MLKLAVQILKSKKRNFNFAKFEDRYENALMQLIRVKRAGKAPLVVTEERSSNVINLMDALSSSAGGQRAAVTRKKVTRGKRTAFVRKAKMAG